MARFVALTLVLCALCACTRSPQPLPVLEWNAELLDVSPLGPKEASLEHCSPPDPCHRAEPGMVLAFPGELRTRDHTQAVLQLGSPTTLYLAESTTIAALPRAARTLTVRQGRVTIQHDGDTPYTLEVLGFTTNLLPSTPVTFSIDQADQHATLTVHQGELVFSQDGSDTVVSAGRTARLTSTGIDQRAVYDGKARATPRVRLEEPTPPAADAAPRGIGRVTARIPGTERTVSGVRLTKHEVRTVIRDGFARTEIEEELHNDTDRVLEGRYVFAIPPRASLSRLALWVGDELVEGELVERERAARIFKGIVDDTVRPRDPALLEWVSGSELSLKIFPIEPHKSRRVVLAYNEALPTEAGTVRYRYPLGLGSDRTTTIDDFALSVEAYDSRGAMTQVRTPHHEPTVDRREDALDARFTAQRFSPVTDFVLEYDVPTTETTLNVYSPDWGRVAVLPEVASGANEATYFALRLTAGLPENTPPPAPKELDRVIVVDRSFSQGPESLRGQVHLANALLDNLGSDERFALLVCDSACSSHPEQGLRRASKEAVQNAQSWLGGTANLHGASNVAGALVTAARRAGAQGQVVYLGDGRATAGELTTASIAERVRPELVRHKTDLRLLGVGRSIDEPLLSGLASEVGATYEAVVSDESLARRTDSLVQALRTPVIVRPRLHLPESFTEVFPHRLPNLRLGQSVLVVGKLTSHEAGHAVLQGHLDGRPYERKLAVMSTNPRQQNPLVPRLWAERKIAALDANGSSAARKEIIRLSQWHHVASRHTSLLVLENERMFAEFGVRRTQRRNARGSAPRSGWGNPDPLTTDTALQRFPKGALSDGSSGGLGLSGLGSSGMGLSGTGSGGGGRGGGIGLGTGPGFGSGHGRLGGSHKTTAPKLRMGGTQVSGRLPREVIQRIVRQNYGRLRMCYERGLRSNPTLEGSVTVRFVIGSDGAVSHVATTAGSLQDPTMVRCIGSSFYGLSFPRPEGGVVTVAYPLFFQPGDSSSSPPHSEPAVQNRARRHPVHHHFGSESWREQGESHITQAQGRVQADPKSRDARQRLISTLYRLGRFAAAAQEARELVRLDPDNAWAHERLAWASELNQDGPLAALELATAVELDHHDAAAQMRVARAYEAAKDEARACAHWRSAAELAPTQPRSRFEAVRCRARLGDPRAATEELGAIAHRDSALRDLEQALRDGQVPAYEVSADTPGWFEARVQCEADQRCPIAVVVTPMGRVVGPWSPELARATSSRVTLTRRSHGRYRTLLVGGEAGAKGKVTVVVDGTPYSRSFEHNGAWMTMVESDVQW